MANYQHDSDDNQFLGDHKVDGVTYDLYLSGQDVVARFGNKGEDYRALTQEVATQLPEGHILREAADRAARKALVVGTSIILV